MKLTEIHCRFFYKFILFFNKKSVFLIKSRFYENLLFYKKDYFMWIYKKICNTYIVSYVIFCIFCRIFFVFDAKSEVYVASLCILFKDNKVLLARKRLLRRARPASPVITATPISIPWDGPPWAERTTARATQTPWTIATQRRYLILCTITAEIYWALVRPTTTSLSERGKIIRISDLHISASKAPWKPRRNCKSYDSTIYRPFRRLSLNFTYSIKKRERYITSHIFYFNTIYTRIKYNCDGRNIFLYQSFIVL